MNSKPVNTAITTRIIPGLSAEYEIVSLPYWAWFWLEDFMTQNKISYQGIYETFGDQGDLNQTLHNLAELHQEYAMREVHNLANDNDLEHDDYMTRIHISPQVTTKPPRALKLPKIYKLFGFIACYSTLDAVWSRRNYEESNKIN